MTISTWAPTRNVIASITNAAPGVVTTTTDHGYISGEYIRFQYDPIFGMTQVINNVYLITVLSPTTFAIDANTTYFGVFNAAATTKQVPQIIPVGEVSSTLLAAEMNTLTPIGGPA